MCFPIREASRAFQFGCFLGAIALASCAVETILNHDGRTRGRKWKNLDPPTLRAAHAVGLPAQTLLSADERIDQGAPIFVRRRNKTAHGNVSDLIRTLAAYDPDAEIAALDQLLKASRFVCEWFIVPWRIPEITRR